MFTYRPPSPTPHGGTGPRPCRLPPGPAQQASHRGEGEKPFACEKSVAVGIGQGTAGIGKGALLGALQHFMALVL